MAEIERINVMTRGAATKPQPKAARAPPTERASVDRTAGTTKATGGGRVHTCQKLPKIRFSRANACACSTTARAGAGNSPKTLPAGIMTVSRTISHACHQVRRLGRSPDRSCPCHAPVTQHVPVCCGHPASCYRQTHEPGTAWRHGKINVGAGLTLAIAARPARPPPDIGNRRPLR